MKIFIILFAFLSLHLSARNLPDPNELPEGVIKIFNSKYGIETYTDIIGWFDENKEEEVDHIIFHIGPLGKIDFIQKHLLYYSLILVLVIISISTIKKKKT